MMGRHQNMVDNRLMPASKQSLGEGGGGWSLTYFFPFYKSPVKININEEMSRHIS